VATSGWIPMRVLQLRFFAEERSKHKVQGAARLWERNPGRDLRVENFV